MGSRKSLRKSTPARMAATLAAMAALACSSCRPVPEQTGAEQAPSSAATSAGMWRKCQPMPQGAVFAGTVLGADGRIYVISGSTQYDVKLTAAVNVYRP